MTLTSITGDEKEHVVTTIVTTVYNGRGSGGGNVSHELIPIDITPYEHYILTILPI